ncbi:MAG TPA: hypothetical protein VLG25_00295 [Patescibacteria group bacterium]|nr:hypothetical protein [Patescibacteria group bacterium]
MFNKNINNHWALFRVLSYSFLIVGLIVSGLIFVFAYRQNNITALSLRDKLLEVDKNNGNVELALTELREFTYWHMNANLSGGASNIYPPIQLKYTYERLVATEKQHVINAQKQVTDDANAHCAIAVPQNGPGTNRIPCITQYIQDHPVKEQPIRDDLYKFDFASPRWSPDRAGWSLVITLIFGLLLASRLILDEWLKHSLAD